MEEIMAPAESNRNLQKPLKGICRRFVPLALMSIIAYACNLSPQPTQDIEGMIRLGIAQTQEKQTQMAQPEAEPQSPAENPSELESTPTINIEKPAPAEVQFYSAEVNIIWEESGSLNSRDAGLGRAANEIRAGMTSDGGTVQAFMSFKISHIPDNATILQVTPVLLSYRVEGDPFSISPLFLFWYPYSDLEDLTYAADFWDGIDPSEILAEWDSLSSLENHAEIPSMVPLVQEAVRNGATRLRVRAHFVPDAAPMTTDNLLIFADQGSQSHSVPMMFIIDYSIPA